MIVVSDSSPLITLSRAQQLELRREFYVDISIPQEVNREVTAAGAGLPRAVFPCHASEDKALVRRSYAARLSDAGFAIWLDEEQFLLGQEWDVEIREAIEISNAVDRFLVAKISETRVHPEGK